VSRAVFTIAVCSLLCLLAAATTQAQVERFALVIGNNRGDGAEGALAYAEADAAKVHAVLRELGGFAPLNMTLLQGEEAATVRATLIELNDRIRSSAERGSESVLFVYYSGHADAEALHLGESRLRMAELAQLVRGSSATVRLLVADACRSGSLTRVKGGKAIPPFALPSEARLPGEGLAFLTASSASEDAQESDEIKGSFFTHALVSGLLGAADRNSDGMVAIEEAYRYAYETTVRATSRTYQGVQHPTFHYDLRGRESVVLTYLNRSPRRAALTLPSDIGFFVLRDDADGAVMAEVPAAAAARTLSLAPGRYFLRGRGAHFLLEGTVSLGESERSRVEVGRLKRVEYARLSRKGGEQNRRAHSLELGTSIHSQADGADAPCIGAAGGYMLDAPHLSLSLRLAGCRSTLHNTFVRVRNREYEISAGALHPWDLPLLTISAGIGAGIALVSQQFATEGRAPQRLVSQPFLQLILLLTAELTQRLFVRLDGRAETHFVKLQERAGAEPQVVAPFVARGALLLGVYIR
jgi:hypothetical protein